MSKFIHWLKTTGEKDFLGKEKLDSLNPFEEVIEHAKYPFARIYRESFWTGIKDTFYVLKGEHFDFFPHAKTRIHDAHDTWKGVLDAFIFPIIGQKLFYKSESFLTAGSQSNSQVLFVLSFIPFLLFAVTGVFLESISAVLSTVLTLGLIPLIATVHGLAYFKARGYKKEIQKLPGRGHINYIEITQTGNLKIERKGEVSFILEKSIKNAKVIEALLATNTGHILNNFTDPNKLLGIQRWIKNPDDKAAEYEQAIQQLDVCQESILPPHTFTYGKLGSSYMLTIHDQPNGILKVSRFKEPPCFIERTEKNAKGIEALLATNAGYILDMIEPDRLEEIQRWIKSPEARMVFLSVALLGGNNKFMKLEEPKHSEEVEESKPPALSEQEDIEKPETFFNMYIPGNKKQLIMGIFQFAGIATEKQLKEVGNSFSPSV